MLSAIILLLAAQAAPAAPADATAPATVPVPAQAVEPGSSKESAIKVDSVHDEYTPMMS